MLESRLAEVRRLSRASTAGAARGPAENRPAATGLLTAALGAVALTALLAVRTAALLRPLPDPDAISVDRAVELVVVPLGLLVAAWLAGWLVLAVLCVAAAGAGARRRGLERVVARHAPNVVRRLLASAVGVGLGLGATAAVATTPPGTDDVGWTVTATIDEPTAPAPTATGAQTAPPPATPQAPPPPPAHVASVRTAAPPATPAPAPAPPPTVVVAPGDSLWRIAARHLPAAATDADVAAAWPRWYASNADVVGPDPDLILPGQVLVVPPSAGAAAGVTP